MAMLGFPSSQAFEHTTLEDIEQAFMHRVYEIEVNRAMGKKDKGEGRKTELRKLNEALQYLIRKRRRLSGRSMQSNWQLGSSKSNEANQVIQVFQKSSGQGLMAQLRAKKAEEDRSEAERKAFKEKQEMERIKAAKELRQQSKAGLSMTSPMTTLLNFQAPWR